MFTGFFLKFKSSLLVTSVFMLICHDNPGFNFIRIVYMFQMMICCLVSASSKWQRLFGTIQSPWRWRQYLSPKRVELLTITRFRNRKEGCHLINNVCENLETCVLCTVYCVLYTHHNYDYFKSQRTFLWLARPQTQSVCHSHLLRWLP